MLMIFRYRSLSMSVRTNFVLPGDFQDPFANYRTNERRHTLYGGKISITLEGANNDPRNAVPISYDWSIVFVWPHAFIVVYMRCVPKLMFERWYVRCSFCSKQWTDHQWIVPGAKIRASYHYHVSRISEHAYTRTLIENGVVIFEIRSDNEKRRAGKVIHQKEKILKKDNENND